MGRWQRLRRRVEQGPDDGFLLLESIISISLIVIVMAGITNFFVSITSLTGQLRTRQGAVMYADNTVDRIRAMQPSDTYIGRTSTAVSSEFSHAPSQVTSFLSQMSQVSDNSGASPKLAMTSQQGGYTATNYIGSCMIPLAAANGTACLASYPNTVSVAAFLRVVVAVTWSNTHCSNSTCAYVTDTLLSRDSDPNFLLNQTPPASPQIVDPSAQTSAINDAVSLQMLLTSTAVVAPVSWSSYVSGTDTLPAGLSIDPQTGLITGSPQGPVTAAKSVTITATEAFGRSDSSTFNWQILADLVPSGLGASYQGPVSTAISTITLTATGGSGSGYSFSVPATGQPGALPPGLTLSAGKITGTPSTAGSYSSVITVQDSTGRTRTLTTAWTIVPPPTVTLPTAAYKLMKSWTVGNQQVNYTCPTLNCTLTLTGAPAGIGLSSAPTGSGTATLAVTAATGTAYLVGVNGSGPATFTVSVAIKEGTYNKTGTPDTATWMVVNPATGVANLTVTRGTAIPNQAVNYACATACTISFTGTLATPSATLSGNWLSPNTTTAPAATLTEAAGQGTFYLRGTPSAANPAGKYTVLVTITDADGNTLSNNAIWTVK